MTTLEEQLRKDLFTIAANWRALLDLPRPPTVHTKGAHSNPAPLPAGVMSLRYETTRVLGCWAHLVWDERHLRKRVDLSDTVGVCRLLTTHAEWLAAHPAAKDAVAEVGSIATTMTGLIAQTRAARFRVGLCPDCPGRLVAVMRNSDAKLPSSLQCDQVNAHTWTYAQWSMLGVRINGARAAQARALACGIPA